MPLISIDGSQGEGGGQILRTALSLSLVTGQPFRIERIRAGRQKSGLLRQHLTAVMAAAQISGAAVEGAALGSPALSFTPGAVRAGEYRFAVGTAGSGTLVFQTVLPALMTAGGPSRLVIEGGTHNMASPPFEFLERAFLPLINRMGPRITARLERYGFYPAGGGRFTVDIEPSPSLNPIHLGRRGAIVARRAVAVVGNLARRIAERELETIAKMLDFRAEDLIVNETRNSPGPGNIVMIEMTSAELTEVFSAFGKLGFPSEAVADHAARAAREYLASHAAAGEHLTDQLLLPMALCGAGSFTAIKLDRHARTNLDVIAMFLPVRFQLQEEEGFWRVGLG